MSDNTELENLLRESIAAQNRTTHAVRALASFVLIQVAWGIPAGTVIAVASSTTGEVSGLWKIVGWILLGIGFFHALIRGLTLLEDSEVPVKGFYGSGSQSGASQGSLTARQISETWDSNDWVNAQRLLSFNELGRWEKAGSPALKPWVDAGRPDFKTWLDAQKP